jgi:hypothetical protein
MMSSRYIKIARKFFESDEWQRPRKFSEQEAWLDMIFLACYADYNLDLGKDGILTLHRGEFYFPQRHLAKRWGWDLTKVNRHLARLAEGDNPRIAKISRETHFETPSETQVATKVVVVKLCNYDSYNSVKNKSETPSETRDETQSETLKNKEYLRRKIDNKTHTQYLELKDLFVRSCVSATREDHEIAAKVAQDMASITMTDGEAAQDHNSRCRKDASFNLLFWLWWKFPKLQLSFDRPLNPTEAKDLLAHYKLDDIGVWIESIENKRDSIPYNRSLYSTIKQWAKNDYSLKQKQ